MSAEGVDGDFEGLPRKRLSGKRIVLFIVLPLVLLMVGAAGVYFSGLLDDLFAEPEPEVQANAEPQGCVNPPPYHELPEVLVNLSAGPTRRTSYMKLRLSLELCRPEEVAQVTAMRTRIVDNLQVYLRELRIEDLRGSAGFQRLREELRFRITVAVQPVQVRDVLFQEVLVQ